MNHSGSALIWFGKNVERTSRVRFWRRHVRHLILEIGSSGSSRSSPLWGYVPRGEDVDARVIDWLVKGFKDEHNIDLRQDRMALQRLKDAAEKANVSFQAFGRRKSTFHSSYPVDATRHCTSEISRPSDTG